jgi:hypothetical protein
MADNLTTFMCRLSWNLRTSTSWNPQGQHRPSQRLFYRLGRMYMTCISKIPKRELDNFNGQLHSLLDNAGKFSRRFSTRTKLVFLQCIIKRKLCWTLKPSGWRLLHNSISFLLPHLSSYSCVHSSIFLPVLRFFNSLFVVLIIFGRVLKQSNLCLCTS